MYSGLNRSIFHIRGYVIEIAGALVDTLTLKAPIKTAADDIHFSEEIRLRVSSEFSARQRIHMKNQALFSSKDKSKTLKCCLLQLLFGALRVNCSEPQHRQLRMIVLKDYKTWVCHQFLLTFSG